MKKISPKFKLQMLMVVFLAILMVTPLQNVKASADGGNTFHFSAADSGILTPSSGSGLIDTPIPFKCAGLIAGTSYSVELNDVVQHAGLVASSGGEINFDITSSSAGVFTVEVVNSTGGANGVVATASVRVNDLVNDIMPYIILFVTITILFGVVAKLKID